MFNNTTKENNPKAGKNGTLGSSSVNLIGTGTFIEGEIKSEGDIRIDGKINGTITSQAKVVVGSTGQINGDMVCQNADISGKITGKLVVGEFLFLKSSAVIEGDITTNKLVVEAGAKFNGSCQMGAARKSQNEEKVSQKLEKATA